MSWRDPRRHLVASATRVYVGDMVRSRERSIGSEPVVMFATDLVSGVTTGLRVASQLAADRAATLLIAHVVPLRLSDGEGMLQVSVTLGSGESLRSLRALTPPDPSVPYVRALRVGDPEDELARLASEWATDLIVLRAEPRSPLRRLLSASLAERLQARVDCPIVTFHDDVVDARKTLETSSNSLPPLVALRTVLDARIHALIEWLEDQGRTAAKIAERDSVRHAAQCLRRASGPWERRLRSELELELAEHAKASQAMGIGLWTDLDDDSPAIAVGREPWAHGHAWLNEALRTGSAVSLPFSAELLGRPLVILATARVAVEDRPAVLVLALDARRGFLRILGQPGPTRTSETYAFDRTGTMLSNSRFSHQLRGAGLVGPGACVPGSLRVCDPGKNLLESAPELAPEAWPLTQMAASAVAGHDGSDARGYRDYRGVPVVGVWRWLPRHGFGVAAEMDLADAQGQRPDAHHG